MVSSGVGWKQLRLGGKQWGWVWGGSTGCGDTALNQIPYLWLNPFLRNSLSMVCFVNISCLTSSV